MAKVTNKQIAEAFKNAIPFLWSGRGDQVGKNIYICHAISAAGVKSGAHLNGNWVPISSALNVISRRLGSSYSADGWLSRRGIRIKPQQKMQAWRKQWLEQLVKEFENK